MRTIAIVVYEEVGRDGNAEDVEVWDVV